jgi:hypothetical protein
MSFRITGLSADSFRPLFGLSDEALAALGARRYVADTSPGFPDRVSLTDLAPGERVLLVNFEHQAGDTPYRARHAVYVREGDGPSYDKINEVPPALRPRTLSLRAFAADHMMVDADIVEGAEVEGLIEKLLANPEVAYLQAHFAKRGCYAARIERA